MPVEQKNCRTQAVAVLDQEGHRPLEEGRPSRRRHEMTAVLSDVADIERWTSAQGVLQQFPRPEALVAGFPDGFPFQTGNRLDTLLAFAAAFDHALEGLKSVDAVDLQLASGRHQGFID